MPKRFQSLVRSLRFRLTAWNTAVVLLAVVATLVGVREGLRLTLLQDLDQLSREDAREETEAIASLYPRMTRITDELNRKALSAQDRGLFIQLFDADLHVIWESLEPENMAPVAKSWDVKPRTKTEGDYLVLEQKLLRREIPVYYLRLGSRLKDMRDDVWNATRPMLFVGAALILVAPLGGYWLARRAIGPIADIISTTARLRPSHLSERLPTRGSGDELDQLSNTINRFLDLIAEYLARNREFVANAAHELRSPLAAIQSSVEVTLNSERPAEEYQDQLYEIGRQCEDLGTLVNQLLLLAETDAARLEMRRTPVRLDQLVEKSVDMFRGAAEERGIHLKVESLEEVTLDADGDRLRQVINNLIDNSLKFTPREGTVRIELRKTGERGPIQLDVADTGVGISPEDLPHVFERFYRGDKSRQRENLGHGNGLGLSICQSIIEAHGGAISVESRPGAGARFSVKLPLAGSAARS